MKKIYIILVSICIGLHSCNILDVPPSDSISDAAVWEDLLLAEAFMNDIYVSIETDNQTGVLWSNFTDETFHMHGYTTDVYLMGNASPDNYRMGYDQKWTIWESVYKAIYNANLLLDRIQDTPTPNDGDEEWKNQIIGQGYFLRGYFYQYLYSLYGRVPLIDKPHSLDSEFNETRADLDDVADFIIRDLDMAASLLPLQYSKASDFRRATRGAAMALKARVLLYKASPLFGTPSPEKWQAAADAHKAVIDLGIYSLRPVSNSDEYQALFSDTYNPEFIFQKMNDAQGIAGQDFENMYHMIPCGPGNGFDGWSTWQPTNNIVEAFQMADGTPYQRGEMRNYQIVSGDERITIQALAENPWENRDIRLRATIITDGDLWGYGSDKREVETFISAEGNAIPSGVDSYLGDAYWNGTRSGYNMKKFFDINYDMYSTLTPQVPWAFIRLAEVYLNYAECLIELGRESEAFQYINLVRNRALLPNATGDVRAAYEYERKIELIFEGQRFFDLRRWMKLEDCYNNIANWPYALTTYKFSDGTKAYYPNDVDPLQRRNMDPSRHYWLPIPRYELNRSPYLDAAPYE